MRNLAMRKIQRRRGSIASLTCLLLVFIFGMVAFAVDTSWLVLAQSELQNTADSAALAGANKLGDNYALYSLPTQSTDDDYKATLVSGAVAAGRATAKNYAAYNSAGSVSNLTLLDSDIDVGFIDAKGVYTSYSSNPNNYPNTVKVTMRRDASANSPLKLFFAPMIGVSSMNMTASAGATIYGGTISSFKVGSSNTGLMPVTFDVNHWNGFIKTGQDADGNATKDGNGNPIMQIYPSIKAPGNFGLISLDDSHVGANTVASWINGGVPPSDIQALLNSGLIPLSSHNPKSWDWNGENGFKSANVMDLNNHLGKTYIIPLFTPLTSTETAYVPGVGLGSFYDYNIVQFVGVKIVPAPKHNREVWIQHSIVADPNLIFDPNSVAPIGTSSTFVTAFAPAKLTN